jgi:hypothetical protein
MLKIAPAAGGGAEHTCVCGMRGLLCQPHDVVAKRRFLRTVNGGSPDSAYRLSRRLVLKALVARQSTVVSRVYCRQLRLPGGATHEAATVCLGTDERTIVSEHHRPVSAPRSSR